MTFRAPEWLWLAATLPLVLPFLIARERRRAHIARRFVSERLRGGGNPLRTARPYVIAAAIAATSLALAGPRAGFTTVEVRTREANRIIAIDVSHSMAAEDIGTSRLAAAKAIARRIIEQHNGRIGLIAFEAGAEVISPLTNDTDALLALADTLQAGEVGQPGSDLGGAVLAALRLIEADPGQKADVILISDGEEQGRRVDDALKRARARGVTVSGIVVGSAEGSTIPARQGVLRDESGEVVLTYARADVLQRLARGTGGRVLENPFSEDALRPLLSRSAPGAVRMSEVRVPVDRYQWPLALAFLAFFGASLLNRGAE
ncbi:MAG TPA: VWA domain-containing protein [Thermoanaerobaculia bacterium]|nr:VWA domain-containing protein [Thermoanaerobaculia bacterium]